MMTIAQRIQTVSFSSEICLLKENKPLARHLQKLSPFLDDNDVLRVGGRLSQLSAKLYLYIPDSLTVNLV